MSATVAPAVFVEAVTPQRRQQRENALWDAMADELVDLISQHLDPVTLAPSPWLSRPLSQILSQVRENSVGAAHWVMLNKALTRRGEWLDALRRNRRSHRETAACCRILEAKANGLAAEQDDWPLAVLKLRAASQEEPPASAPLSHAVPMARHTLRTAYWAVAKEVHPDRIGSERTPLATEAMTVLNEAYRQAVLQFTMFDRDVIRLDALGIEHDALM